MRKEDPPMVTANRLQAHWSKVKSFIKQEWPLLSETEIENIRGDFDLFLKYLKRSYPNFPLEEERSRDKLQRYLNSLEETE